MNSVPTRVPAMIAISAQMRFTPIETPIAPTASVDSCALPWNHTGPRCHGFPCRSLTGT